MRKITRILFLAASWAPLRRVALLGIIPPLLVMLIEGVMMLTGYSSAEGFSGIGLVLLTVFFALNFPTWLPVVVASVLRTRGSKVNLDALPSYAVSPQAYAYLHTGIAMAMEGTVGAEPMTITLNDKKLYVRTSQSRFTASNAFHQWSRGILFENLYSSYGAWGTLARAQASLETILPPPSAHARLAAQAKMKGLPI